MHSTPSCSPQCPLAPTCTGKMQHNQTLSLAKVYFFCRLYFVVHSDKQHVSSASYVGFLKIQLYECYCDHKHLVTCFETALAILSIYLEAVCQMSEACGALLLPDILCPRGRPVPGTPLPPLCPIHPPSPRPELSPSGARLEMLCRLYTAGRSWGSTSPLEGPWGQSRQLARGRAALSGKRCLLCGVAHNLVNVA